LGCPIMKKRPKKAAHLAYCFAHILTTVHCGLTQARLMQADGNRMDGIACMSVGHGGDTPVTFKCSPIQPSFLSGCCPELGQRAFSTAALPVRPADRLQGSPAKRFPPSARPAFMAHHLPSLHTPLRRPRHRAGHWTRTRLLT